MMTADQPVVFRAILVRPSVGKRLLGATMWVVVLYAAAIVGLIAMSDEVVRPPPKQKRELVVTLLDAPRIAKLRTLGTLGGGTSGESARGKSTDPLPRAIEARAPRPSARSRSKPRDKAKSLPQDRPRALTGVAVQPEPTVSSVASAGAQVEAKGASATAASTATGGAAEGPGQGGSTGGAGLIGSGKGSGSGGKAAGAGAGTRGGMASGDTEILPFMDGMSRPSLISKVDPTYTREARDSNVSGLILAKCVITTEGRLRRCRIVKGLPLMDQAVLAALSQWRYSPVLYQGKPVSVEYVIPVRLVGP